MTTDDLGENLIRLREYETKPITKETLDTVNRIFTTVFNGLEKKGSVHFKATVQSSPFTPNKLVILPENLLTCLFLAGVHYDKMPKAAFNSAYNEVVVGKFKYSFNTMGEYTKKFIG